MMLLPLMLLAGLLSLVCMIWTLVRIGPGSWIGSATVVLADIGADTVVGAGSVVTRPLPDRVIAAGVPARIIRQRGEGRP